MYQMMSTGLKPNKPHCNISHHYNNPLEVFTVMNISRAVLAMLVTLGIPVACELTKDSTYETTN